MEKEWYIKIKEHREGPYTVDQLKRHKEVTPDTFVWDEENAVWVPIRTIPELLIIFKDPATTKDPDILEEDIKVLAKEKEAGELVLQLGSEPPSIFFWLLIFAAIMFLIVLYTKL
ncbi:MAG: DUF4339 domain-containing protein [Parachlamydiaceae bacterium]|nr:DUF4339 domain-containing protein [Parachlamydiaceae bacterium]